MSDACMLSWRTEHTPKTHTHRCTRGIDHHGTCRCVCGEFLPEFVGLRGSEVSAVRYPTSGRAAIARHGMSTVEMTPAPLISMRGTRHHTDPVVSRVPCRPSFSDLAAFVVAVAVAVGATVAGVVLWRSADRVTASAPFLLAGAMGYCAACLLRGAS